MGVALARAGDARAAEDMIEVSHGRALPPERFAAALSLRW